MSDRDKSQEQLIHELSLLRQEVAELKITKTAFDAQNQLLRSLVTMLQTATGKLMLRAMLQQTLTIARDLTNAEDGSLFLLSSNGVVTESILARGATIRAQRQRLVGEVLDKGLAGWVVRNCQIGLITDTMHDERWLTLPNQPYVVRSVLCVPILKGRELLGVITLMHSEPGHFSPESAHLMKMTAEQMALILDNARLYTERQQADKLQTDKKLYSTAQPVSNGEDISLLGIYIMFGEGNFLYANSRFAEIFGYTFGELVSLESVLDLIAPSDRNSVNDQINECLQGHLKYVCCKFKGQHKDGNVITVELYGTRTKLYGKFVLIGALKLI